MDRKNEENSVENQILHSIPEEQASGAEVEEDIDKGRSGRSSSTGQRCFDAWVHAVDEYLKKPILRALIVTVRTAALHPRNTILMTIAVSFALAITGLYTNFEIETDGNTLWTPFGAKPVVHGDWIDYESGFPPIPRSFRVIVHAQGDNILTVEGAGCMFDVIDTIRSTKGYQRACFDSGGAEDCPIVSATGLFDHNRTILFSQAESDEGVRKLMSELEFPGGEPVTRSVIFGYPEPALPPTLNRSNLSIEDVQLQSVKSFLGDVWLSPEAEISNDFELAATLTVYELNDVWDEAGVNCVAEVYSERSFDDELARGITNDIVWMVIAFLIMGCFCAIYLGQRKDLVRSQSIVGLGAVATIILSIMSGYGLLFSIGVPFSSVTQIFPYVMVGIGLDDTFIITGAFSRTDRRKDVVERIVETIEEVGISIFVSTLTTVVAFFLGCASSLPGIRWFCLYAAPTVMIDFLYQITFFIAILVYDDRRMRDNRYDCLVCVKSKASINRDEEPTLSSTEETPFMTKLMSRYCDFLLRPWTKVFVLVVFAAMLGIGAFFASKQRQELDFRDLTPPDSFVRTYFDAFDTYSSPSKSAFLRAGVYFRDGDVPSAQFQEQMKTYVDNLVDIPFISNEPEYFWLNDFTQFIQSNTTTAPLFSQMGTSIGALSFTEQLDKFLQTPPFDELYRADIVRDENGVVTASRCFVVFDQSSLIDVKLQIDSLQKQREVTQAQAINEGKSDWAFFTFSSLFYAWELYLVIVDEILWTVIFGLVSVFAISLIFIPHPIGALLLTPVVAAIYCELVAVLYLAGIYINGVSAIGLVMCIGLVVDYNMHVVLTYFDIKDAASRDERVRKVLTTMGTSLLLGGFTTFLGVLPLSLTGSEVFRTFFYSFLTIPALGIAHGVVLVPVILSLIGPHKQSLSHQRRDIEPEDNESTVGLKTQPVRVSATTPFVPNRLSL